MMMKKTMQLLWWKRQCHNVDKKTCVQLWYGRSYWFKAPYRPHQRSAQPRQLQVCRTAAYSELRSWESQCCLGKMYTSPDISKLTLFVEGGWSEYLHFELDDAIIETHVDNISPIFLHCWADPGVQKLLEEESNSYVTLCEEDATYSCEITLIICTVSSSSS